MKRVVLGVVAAIVLAGCQSLVGEGPVTFSPASALRYHHYHGQDDPSVFAVSVDGRASSYSYCPWNYVGQCQATPDPKMIAICEERSGGVPCKIFARQEQIVWKNPGDFLVNHPQGQVRLDGTEPVLYGDGLQQFQQYRRGGLKSKNKAFAINYRRSTNELLAVGWDYNYDTREEAIAKAMDVCRLASGERSPKNCKVYMVNDEKVWFTEN